MTINVVSIELISGPQWVTWATLITGHTALIQGACFIGAQMVGAITGAAITKGLRGPGRDDLGCFSPSDISHAQLWGQETINTFLLIITVFAVAVSQKVVPAPSL